MSIPSPADGGTHSIFNEKAADYAASRPDYPATLYETLKTICPPKEDVMVADVGSGTGILTEALLKNGYRVTAVEPNAEMRQVSDLRLGQVPGYRSLDGCAETIPLPSTSVHLITAAQAFHWFEIDRARVEFLRVLTPQGQVALIWNDRALEDPVSLAVDEVFIEFGGAKRGALLAREGYSEVRRFFGSNPPQKFSWPHVHSLDREGLLGLVFSRSYIPGRNTATGPIIADRVGKIFDRFAASGMISMAYRTKAFIGRPKFL